MQQLAHAKLARVKTLANVGMGVLLLMAACPSSSSRPCAREMAALQQREALRIHGLTENDDAREAMARLQSAARCAREADVAPLRTYAWLLESRLEARGSTDELVALHKLLSDVGMPVELPEQTQRAPARAAQRLSDYAAAMRAAAGDDADAQLRAHVASLGLDPDHAGVFPKVTRAFVNHSHKTEGCFTVVNHQELPTGTAVVTLKRNNAPIALHGESPTFGVSKGKPRVVRLCTDGPLHTDDVVQISVAGESVWEQKLAVVADDEVRGALRRNFVDGDVVTLCSGVKEHSARVACAMAAARSQP